jgi:hypothetical protein
MFRPEYPWDRPEYFLEKKEVLVYWQMADI